MAAPTLTPTALGHTGYDLTNLAAANVAGDSWVTTGVEQFVIKNAAGAPITLTLVFGVNAKIDGVAPANETVSIPAGHTMMFGPFLQSTLADASGNMNVTYSAITSITVGVVKPGVVT